jgi:PhnB protein
MTSGAAAVTHSGIPPGWHSVTPRIVVEDPVGLVAFLRHVFDATGDLQTEAPSQITIGDSTLLVSKAGSRDVFPAFLYVYVLDAEVTCRRAVEAGATSVEAVWDTPYGDRRGMVRDRWGNVWQVATRVAR